MDRTKAPINHPIKAVELVHPDRFELSNGVPVFTVNGGEQEICRIEVIFKAGTAHQKQSLIASLTGKMLTEGTNDHSGTWIAEELDQYGAYFQVNTSADHTTIALFSLNRYLNKTIPVLAEVIASCNFPEDELQTQCANGKEKLRVNMEKVANLSKRAFMEHLFDGHPYGRFALPDDYDNVDRNDLIKFYDDHIRGCAFDIIVAGKVSEYLHTILQRYLGSLKAEKRVQDVPLLMTANEGETVFVHKEGAIQSGVTIGKTGVHKKDEEFHRVQFVNTLLGGYFGSRLMSNLREDKGYTYGISSGLVSLQASGYFTIRTEVGIDYTDDTLHQIRLEIDRLRNETVSPEEMELVRNYMIGSFVRNSDGPFAMADRFKSLHIHGLGYDHYDRYTETVSAMTANAVMEVAREYLDPASFTWVVAGSSDPFQATK